MRVLVLTSLVALASAGCEKRQTVWTPEKLAAVHEARASLTNFIDALQAYKTDRTKLLFCQVCAPFPAKTGQGGGFAWVHVWEYDGTAFMGGVVQAEPSLNVTNNQLVTIPATNVIDWTYLSETGLVGRFVDHASR